MYLFPRGWTPEPDLYPPADWPDPEGEYDEVTKRIATEIDWLWRASAIELTELAGTANHLVGTSVLKNSENTTGLSTLHRGMRFVVELPIAAEPNEAGGTLIDIDDVADIPLRLNDGSELPEGYLQPEQARVFRYTGTELRELRPLQDILAGARAPDYVFSREETAGTHGGASTSGAWEDRVLNTVVRAVDAKAQLDDTTGEITLDKGKWMVKWRSAVHASGRAISRLYNDTDAALVRGGTPEQSGADEQAWSKGVAFLDLAASKVLKLQSRVQTSRATDGLGQAANLDGVAETFDEIEITAIEEDAEDFEGQPSLDSWPYEYDDAILGVDPGQGKFGFDSLDFSAATAMVLSHVDGEQNDVAPLMDFMFGGSGVVKALLRVVSRADKKRWRLFKVTDRSDDGDFSTLDLIDVGGSLTSADDAAGFYVQLLPLEPGSAGTVDGLISAFWTTMIALTTPAASRAELDIENLREVGDEDAVIAASERVVATSEAFTTDHEWELPSASGCNPGQLLFIADNAGAFSPDTKLTLVPAGGDTIAGASSLDLTVAGTVLALVSNGVDRWQRDMRFDRLLSIRRQTIGNVNATIKPSTRIAALTATLTAPRQWTLPDTEEFGEGFLALPDEAGGIGPENYLELVAAGDNTISGQTSIRLHVPYSAPILWCNGLAGDQGKWTLQNTSTGMTLVGDETYNILPTDKVVALGTALTTDTRRWILPRANAVPRGTAIGLIDLTGSVDPTTFLALESHVLDTLNGSIAWNVMRPYFQAQAVSDGVSKWSVDPLIFGDFDDPITFEALVQFSSDVIAQLITLQDLSNPFLDGTGITFPATQDPSTNANTLDDYEEGTWTPTVTAQTVGNLSVSYSTRTGAYTKIGNLVHLNCNLAFTATHTTASGDFRVTGIPFSPALLFAGPIWAYGANWNNLPAASRPIMTAYVTGSIITMRCFGAAIAFLDLRITDNTSAAANSLGFSLSGLA